MVKRIFGVVAAFLAVVLVVPEADARRLGGGRAFGVQRNVTPPPARQQAAPAQKQALPATAGAAAAAKPATGLARWMPLLAGLTIGGMLGYLFGGDGLMGLLLLAALAVAAVSVVRALMPRRGEVQPQRMEFAAMGNETVAAPPPSQAIDSGGHGAARFEYGVPAGFDAEGFLRGAKMNFLRLQAANDQGNLDELRDLTTAEVFETLKNDLQARGQGSQRTDLASVDAELLEIGTDGDRHWASVRFTGMEQEGAGGKQPVEFSEVWNLVKPVDDSSGWLLAGIQQMH